MPAIDLSRSTLAARERIIATLAEHLPAELDLVEAENPGYLLPDPEHYIRTNTTFEEAFAELAVDQVACWVVKDSPARPETWQSADTGGKMAAEQRQRWRVAIIAMEPGAFNPEPLPEGRLPTLKEWMDTRAELYKGAVLDVLGAEATDTINIHEILPLENDATAITIQAFGGLVSQASVIVEVEQEVLADIKVNPAS